MSTQKTDPSVSIIMAVYNGERFLYDTIQSLLHQTFRDFEYIIINDGSSDETPQILEGFADSRIIILHNEQNNGLPYSLNKALTLAQRPYVARIDAGDLAAPERLEQQVAFLEKHPEIGIVGTCGTVIDPQGTDLGEVRFPKDDLYIRWMSLLNNPFLHPSVMLRRNVLIQHHLAYDIAFHAAQDYDLWTRLLEHTQAANLPECLLTYRISETSITQTKRTEQLRNHDLIAYRTIQRELPEFAISPELVSQLREAFSGGMHSRREQKKRRVALAAEYLELLTAFAQKYRQHPEIKRLQQQETLKIATLVSRLRYRSAWLPVMRRAVRLYPGIGTPLLKYLLKKYVYKHSTS